jgi:hypothetical protein
LVGSREESAELPPPTATKEFDAPPADPSCPADSRRLSSAGAGTRGDKLGSVYNFMVDKRSGKVEYAVMSFGGFLGIGDSYHPLPWESLDYDTRMGGYVVDIDRSRLEGAPTYRSDEDPWRGVRPSNWTDRAAGD